MRPIEKGVRTGRSRTAVYFIRVRIGLRTSPLTAQRVGALAVIEAAMLIANAPAVAALALKQRLPSCGWPDFAIGGGVMGYGVDYPDMFRRAATFVDKILKGAKPGDLPIERSTKFEIIVNLNTAKALGLPIPNNFLARADQVIE